MADQGIKIAKQGYSADAIPTETTKKNFIILDATNSHKVVYKGYVTSGSYTHGLGKRPFFRCFTTDSTTSPTYFSPALNVLCNSTQITNIPNPSYLIVFNEGQ